MLALRVEDIPPDRVLPRTLKMVHTASLSSTRQLRDRVWEEVTVTAMVYVASHEVLHLWEQQFLV